MARPKSEHGERLEENSFASFPWEKEAMKAAASRAGMALATWQRNVCLRAAELGGGLEPPVNSNSHPPVNATTETETTYNVAAHSERSELVLEMRALKDEEKAQPLQEKSAARALEEEKKVKKKMAAKFVPPTLEEVQAEIKSRKKCGVDAEMFWAFYEANGWVQGSRGKPIKSWKACLTTWQKNDGLFPKPAGPFRPFDPEKDTL
jgi:hypothetical protein